MPMRIWEFFFYSVAPLLYLKGAVTIGLAAYGWIFAMIVDGAAHRFSNTDSQVMQIVAWFSVLFTVEIIQSYIAIRLDDEDPRLLRSLLLQRFYFRQLIYLTLWMAWFRALTGAAPGWGILSRHGSVVSVRTISHAGEPMTVPSQFTNADKGVSTSLGMSS